MLRVSAGATSTDDCTVWNLCGFMPCVFSTQVASALHHLQCKNVAHRDIKLENILFFTPTDVKVVDFGLAAEMRSSNPLLTTICGSLLYVRRIVVLFCNNILHDYQLILCLGWFKLDGT